MVRFNECLRGRRSLVTLVALCGCGRIAFDPIDAAGDTSVFTQVLGPAGGSCRRLANGEAPGVFYAAFDGNRVFRTNDGGGTWLECARAGYSAVIVDGSGTVYAGDDDVFESRDRCATWQPTGIGANVYDTEIIAGRLYAATALGVRVREGGVWSAVTTPFEGSLVTTIVADPTGGTILVGSRAGGIVRSIDGGMSWNVANAGLPNLSISDISVA